MEGDGRLRDEAAMEMGGSPVRKEISHMLAGQTLYNNPMPTPEELARQNIDAQLNACGWAVQDRQAMNLYAGRGVAVREFPTDKGEADYLLFVDRKAAGVVEAKPEGTTLSGVAEQAGGYATTLPPNIPHVTLPLPFLYESTGVETYFSDGRDPQPRSRRVFTFHRPETLAEWLGQPDTLRGRLAEMPVDHPLASTQLWSAQVEAITNLEKSFAADRPRALVQMATGSGKTFTAVNFVYRLIKHAKARRVLFLVDRNNLGRQTFKEFDQFVTPDDGRKFSELYNVQHLQSNVLDDVSKVHITTIQRLYSMLRGEEAFDPQNEEASLWEAGGALQEQAEKDVGYNPRIPIEYYDFIVTDECHRSIYNLWRQVLAIFRRNPDRTDRHAEQADLRLLQPEPGDGVPAPAGGDRRGERGRRGVPHPHTDQRRGQHDREGLVGGASRQAHAQRALGAAGRGLLLPGR